MTTACKLRFWTLSLAAFSVPAMAHFGHQDTGRLFAPAAVTNVSAGLLDRAGPMLAGASRGQMQIGLTIVAPPAEPDAADEADLTGIDAEVRCESSDLGYRECTTPFRGPARVAHEVSDVMCIEGGNWGWRDGAVWVDRGCRAVFVGEAAASNNASIQGAG